MRRIAWLAAPCVLLVAVYASGASTPVPALVPVDDPLAPASMLPIGISQNQPDLTGQYAQVWELADGTQVIQYYGDFSLQLGQRRLRSREAVIWMQKNLWQKTHFYHYEVCLSKEAEVRDTLDTVRTGPLLFVTFDSLYAPLVGADVHTGKAGSDTTLYAEAAKTRQLMTSGAFAATQAAETAPLATSPLQKRPRQRPLLQYSFKEHVYDEKENVVTATGDVYLSQGTITSADFQEIRADTAVLFLAERPIRPSSPPASVSDSQPFPTEAPRGGAAGGAAGTLGSDFASSVTGAYLRGNVVITRGEQMIRASELYYDFENDRALMLDAVMRANLPQRNDIPLYIRAKEIRQLSSTEFFARKADLSASDFYTPHVSFGAERIYLTDTTPRDANSQIMGLQSGQYRAYDTTLNVEGVPIAYWPYSQGDFQQSQNLLQRVRMSFSDDFGATFQSRWYLFGLLGLETPQGVDASLRLDYFSKRGPGVGIESVYEQKDYYGVLRTYYIHDEGSDNLGPFRSGPPDTENRGRFTIRHRQFLPLGIELTLEASYLSDPNFLEEYFRNEFETGKEQETLVYLKKQQDNWAVTTLAQWRILDFLTQTEHLPDMGFNWIGQPLFGLANFYTDSRIGWVRYKPDDRRVYTESEYQSDIVFRTDSRNEVDIPLKLGDVNLVPFAVGRPSYWDDSPVDGQGSVGRMFGMVGARLGTQFWRTFSDITSRVFDINGIRHIIRPQATGWLSGANRDSRDLYPFDQNIESINDFYGSSLALRNSWQTKRGGPGRWRTVELAKFDVEMNVFGNQPSQPLFWSYYNKQPIGRFYDSRPENSIARNHVRTDFMYRLSDTTAILSDTNWDLTDGSMDLFNISYAVERTPRFSYFVGYRRIGDTQSNLVGGGFNYQINEKHTLAIRSYYDLDRGELEQLDLAVIRKWPRFNTAVTLGLNQIEDNFQIGLTIWPEGMPNTAIGNRQFTNLSEGIGLRGEN